MTPALLTAFVFGMMLALSCSVAPRQREAQAGLLFKNVNLINGLDSIPRDHTDILLQGDTIAAIGTGLVAPNATVTDLTGKTIMPALISTHVHVGVLKGTATSAGNYTRQNLFDQLKKYADYGVLNIQTMGTDRPMLFQDHLYDSVRTGLLPGARMLSAGYGFGVPEGNLAISSPMNLLYRPATAGPVAAEMDSLANLKIGMVKIWVDDFGGSAQKMDEVVYQAIIREAHKRHLRVAAHVYYLSDARKLIREGVDIIAHSIRDSVVDESFLSEMKERKVIYIPTLSLDEFSFIYAREPEWINDPFFKASLEPGVFEMITSQKYRNDLRNSPAYSRNINGLKIALLNLKKIADAGILVALGTDSGALPIRAQGFSEHLELELMVQAGLNPVQVIGMATKNAAEALKINSLYGTLEIGKSADLIILNADPSRDIKHTRRIESVYKAGKKIK